MDVTKVRPALRYAKAMNSHHKGDFAEALLISALRLRGLCVAKPFSHSQNWDLAVETECGALKKLQVKYCNFSPRDQSYRVRLDYLGNFDYLCVYLNITQDWYFIPKAQINGQYLSFYPDGKNSKARYEVRYEHFRNKWEILSDYLAEETAS